jgi:oligopeptide/dipeptide ABC transporter ATP-binding protein
VSGAGGSAGEVLLEADGLVKEYRPRGAAHPLRAVAGVSFAVHAGETLALVGESGCGKSTTARMVTKLLAPTSGQLRYQGVDVTGLSRRRMRRWRPLVQMVFQDPSSSLDPRFTVREIVAEPLRIHGRYRRDGGGRRVDELLERVGIDPAYGDRKAAALSGGQRQRLGIARALALEPRVLVLDEPVSALDASVQAQILNLFKDLQRELGIAYLFISHDLSVVRNVADRVAVMYLGRIVETGRADQIFEASSHPYTHGLLSAVPIEHPTMRTSERQRLYRGEPADPAHPPSGCPYRTRCYKAQDRCAEEHPQLADVGLTASACFYPESRALLDIRAVN